MRHWSPVLSNQKKQVMPILHFVRKGLKLVQHTQSVEFCDDLPSYDVLPNPTAVHHYFHLSVLKGTVAGKLARILHLYRINNEKI